MKKRILVTGSEGLIGRHLSPRLQKLDFEIIPLDIALGGDLGADVCDYSSLESLIPGCVGIIHLAAVSRVVWAQNAPDKCWETNAIASTSLLEIAMKQPDNPWVLFASSREVYGEPLSLPVLDCTDTNPINIYGKSKLHMEQAALAARQQGLRVAIARLANVYGCTADHHDRVIPAFCRAAVEGKPLRIDGLNNTFDFTHVEDTVLGLILLVERLEAGAMDLPPMHFLPGIPTTLEDAANMAITAAKSSSKIVEAPSRNYDVTNFYGLALEANKQLNWKAKVTPKQGIEMLVSQFQKELSEIIA